MAHKDKKFEELSLTKSEEESLYYTFKMLVKIFEKLGIKYFVSFGTLIGAIRHGRRMPWDDDIDVVISADDSHKLKEFIGNGNNEVHCKKHSRQICTWRLKEIGDDVLPVEKSDEGDIVCHYKPWGMPFKVWKTGTTKELDDGGWGWPFIDINTYQVWEDKVTVPKNELKYGHIKSFEHPVDSIFPLKKADFDGMCVPVPANAVEVIQNDFGKDVLTSCVVSYNHKITKWKFKQLYENELASDIEAFRLPIEDFDSFNAKNHRWSDAINGNYCKELFYGE